MDYKKIHDTLINYCKTTKSMDRLKNRSPDDQRLSCVSLYVEVHHVIPRSLGGTNDEVNLVELLPEEHIFIHMLRYKIFGEREDMLAVRFMLNGYTFNGRKRVSKVLNKKLRMGYAWIRHQAAGLRANKGWHTNDGKKRISDARKGTIVVKDSVTGEKIGCVSTSHENVLNGKWVHHSKGKKLSEKQIDCLKEKSKGQNNPNASGLSDSYFIETGKRLAQEFGRILSWPEIISLSQERGFKWIKSHKSRFGGLGLISYYEELERITGFKYDPWARRRKL